MKKFETLKNEAKKATEYATRFEDVIIESESEYLRYLLSENFKKSFDNSKRETISDYELNEFEDCFKDTFSYMHINSLEDNKHNIFRVFLAKSCRLSIASEVFKKYIDASMFDSFNYKKKKTDKKVDEIDKDDYKYFIHDDIVYYIQYVDCYVSYDNVFEVVQNVMTAYKQFNKDKSTK